MRTLPGLGARRTAGAVVLCLVAGAACSSTPEVVERPPDAFGWVVEWEQTPDYRYEPAGRGSVIGGSVAFTLEDGTRFSVVPATELWGPPCQALSAPGAGYQPCWVHVGLSADRSAALWLSVFRTEGWVSPEPGAIPAADRVTMNQGVAGEHDGRLVLDDGTVLPFDRSRVEMACQGGRPSFEAVLGEMADEGLLVVVVDPQSGEVIQLDCRARI